MPESTDHGVLSDTYVSALEAHLRSRAPRAARLRRRRRAATGTTTVAAVAVVALLALSANQRTVSDAQATTVVLDGGATTRINANSTSLLAATARQLERSGLTLRLRYVPVAHAAAGRVLDIAYPDGVRIDGDRAIVPEGLTGDVIATIGRQAQPGEDTGTRGLSMFEANPQLCPLVDPGDALASTARLRAAGYRVTVNLVAFPMSPGGRQLPGPALTTPMLNAPAGTVVLTVADDHWGVSRVDAGPDRAVSLEVIDPAGLPSNEPVGPDIACAR